MQEFILDFLVSLTHLPDDRLPPSKTGFLSECQSVLNGANANTSLYE